MFFNETTANYLQQVAVFVEVTGFVLVIIEVYLPTTARNIENTVDRLASTSVKSLRDMDPRYMGKKDRPDRSIVLDAILSFTLIVSILEWMGIPTMDYIFILLIVFFSSVIGFLVTIKFGPFFPRSCLGCVIGTPIIMLISLTGIIMLSISIVPTLLIFYPMSKLLSFFDIIGRGKAIGALGLLLSLTGLCFELYQVTTLCLSSGCYGF